MTRPKRAGQAQSRPVRGEGARRGRSGRKPILWSAHVRRKNLLLDQRKLDFLRERLGLSTDQEVVERVIDEAVIDHELIAATVDLGGTFPHIVDVGRPR